MQFLAFKHIQFKTTDPFCWINKERNHKCIYIMIITFLVLLNEYRPRIKQVHENQDNSKHNNNEKIQPD